MAKLKDGTRVYGGLQVDNTLTVANITISGNLIVSGTTTAVNSTVTQLQDPLFELGTGANGAALSTDDGKERGILMHYWNGSADTSAYMGWHTSNAQFEFGAAATETSGNVVIGTYGNVKAFHYYGEGDTLANITGANVTGWVAQANFANFAGTVTGATQSNITLLGTQTGLTVSGTSNLAVVNANGITTLSNATTSTSTTSGALVVTGGVGIGGNLYVGGTLYANISGTTSAPGSNTQVAFNDAGTTNATAGFTFDKTSNTVSTTALVLSGLANVGGNLNMTAATGNIIGTTLIVDASTELKTEGGSSNVTLSTSGAVIATTGGTVTVNNDGNIAISAGALNVNSNASIYSNGSANVKSMIATGSGNVGTANVGSAIVRDLSQDQIPFLNGDSRLVGEATFKYTTGTSTLTVANATLSGTANAANVVITTLSDTRIPFANGGKALVDSANLTFNSTSNTLSVFNATLGGTANVAEVIVTTLTSTRVPFADTDKSLTDDSTFKFTTVGSKLEVGNVDLTGALVAANVTSNNLTSGRVALAGTAGKLEDSTNLTFNGTVLTVTGNVAATNIKTDNLLYANGTAWDLQQAAGTTAGVIQYNDGSNNFAASANLSFNTTGNVLTTDSLVLNAGANIAGDVIAANLRSNALTSGRVVLGGASGLLSDSSSLTFGSGNLGVAGNIVMSGASANITGVNYLLANIANVIDINSTGNANIGGWLNAKDTVITGNLTVTGTTTSVNTTVSQLTDPLFELGGGANGASLSTNDAYDRGLFMHTRVAGTNKDLFMGWDTSNTEFILAKNVTVSDNVVTVPGTTDAERAANLGDLRLSNIYAYNANFGGVVFSEGNVTLGSGKFIGDLQGNVSGNISGNIKVAGSNGSVQFATNVTDHFGPTVNATTVVSSTKYKIIAVGDSDFTTFGSPNNTLGTIFTANATGTGTGTVQVTTTYGDLANDGANLIYASGNLSVNVGTGGYVKTDYLTGTLTTASQPNVTSVGTLTSLSTSGNISISNATPTNGILTDNLYYTDGTAWDLQQASGANTEIQFNIDDNFSSSSKFTFNPTGNVFTVDGNANITSNLFTQTTTVSSLTATRVTFAGTSGKLEDSANMTFATGSNTLSVFNATLAGTVQAAEVIITSLTPTRVPFVDSNDSLTDDANLTFASNELKVTGTANVTSTLTAANVIVTGLTGGRITFAEVSTDQLTDSGNLRFDASADTFTTWTANVNGLNVTTTANVTGNLSAGNVSGGNLVTATYLTGTLTTASQGNITSVGTLTTLAVSGTSNLNAISNVTITGGSDGQIIKTDGAGNLSFVSNDTTRIVNGTSDVTIATSGGNAVTTINSATILTVSGTGANVVGVVGVTGNITANNITSTNFITANSTTDATSAITGAIHTEGGISAKGNIYAGKAVGFAVGTGGNTDSAAYIQYNSTSGSLDFIFN